MSYLQTSTATTYLPEEYSPKEVAKLKKFRVKVENLDLTPENLEDAHLIRWLRARNLSTTKAYKMLAKSLKWRKENNIDGLLEREESSLQKKGESAFAMCGVDKSGYPILICPMGSQDTREDIAQYGPELMFHHQLIYLEKMMQILKNASKEQGRPVSQFVQIVDMEGFSIRTLFTDKECADLTSKAQSVMENNYPGIVHYRLVVNMPTTLRVLDKLIKPLMSKRTRAMEDVYGNDKDTWKKVVADKFPLELIPPRWGGTRTGSDEFCSKDDIWVYGSLQYFDPKDPKLISATISAREILKIKLNVDKVGSSIEWKFKLDGHDIRIQILFENDKVVLPFTRVAETKVGTVGKHMCDGLGSYTFLFDNSYSAKGKQIFYNVHLLEGTESN